MFYLRTGCKHGIFLLRRILYFIELRCGFLTFPVNCQVSFSMDDVDVQKSSSDSNMFAVTVSPRRLDVPMRSPYPAKLEEPCNPPRSLLGYQFIRSVAMTYYEIVKRLLTVLRI